MNINLVNKLGENKDSVKKIYRRRKHRLCSFEEVEYEEMEKENY